MSVKILVTGGCGYLGSSLLRGLARAYEGGVIRVVDNVQNHIYNAIMDLPNTAKFEFIEADILDPSITRMALKDIDIVIHLAAIVRTPMSFQHPTWVHQINHWATSQLLEASLKANIEQFIFTSSTAVYGPGGVHDELGICQPIGPYASSKRAAELDILKARDRGLNVLILRLGMVYGIAPHTRLDGFINRLSYLCGIGKPLTIYGSGDQKRPVVHHDDASQAIIFAIRENLKGEIYNVVTGNLSVLEVAKILQELSPDTRLTFTEQDILNHLSFEVSPKKLMDLGWRGNKNLVEGIDEIRRKFSNIHMFKSSHGF